MPRLGQAIDELFRVDLRQPLEGEGRARSSAAAVPARRGRELRCVPRRRAKSRRRTPRRPCRARRWRQGPRRTNQRSTRAPVASPASGGLRLGSIARCVVQARLAARPWGFIGRPSLSSASRASSRSRREGQCSGNRDRSKLRLGCRQRKLRAETNLSASGTQSLPRAPRALPGNRAFPRHTLWSTTNGHLRPA